jgi:hypothetical protein
LRRVCPGIEWTGKGAERSRLQGEQVAGAKTWRKEDTGVLYSKSWRIWQGWQAMGCCWALIIKIRMWHGILCSHEEERNVIIRW